MGGGGKQSIKQSIDIKSSTTIIEKNIQENTQKVQASATANNKLKVKIGDVVGCNLDFTQKATADAQSSATQSIDSIMQSKQEVANDMKSKVAAAMEKSTQAGNFQFGDKSNTEIDIKKDIDTTIENVFEKKNLQDVVGNAVATNEAEIEIGNYDCTLGGQLDLTQDASAKVAATAVMADMTKKLMETKSINKLAEEIDAKQKTENKGAAEVVDSVGDAAAGIIGAATGPMKYAMIAAVVGCIVCGLIIAMMSMSKGGSKTLNRGMNLAAMRMKMPPMPPRR